jgi:hypothetical protein
MPGTVNPQHREALLARAPKLREKSVFLARTQFFPFPRKSESDQTNLRSNCKQRNALGQKADLLWEYKREVPGTGFSLWSKFQACLKHRSQTSQINLHDSTP